MNQQIQVPQDIDAEYAILAILILNDTSKGIILTSLTPEHFHDMANRTIFQACVRLHNRSEPINRNTIFDNIKRQGTTRIVEVEHLARLTVNFPVIEDIHGYIGLAINALQLRQLQAIHRKLGEKLGADRENPQDIVAHLKEQLENLAKPLENTQPFGTALLKKLDEWEKQTKTPLHYPRWPNNDLDAVLDGFPGSALHVVAGYPGSGKSAFALQIADSLSRQRHPVLLFSLEMSPAACERRIARNQLRMDPRYTGRENGPHRDDIERWCAENQDRPLFIEQVSDLDTILARINYRALAGQCRVAIIDHIGHVSVPGTKSEYETLNAVSKAFLKTSRELNIDIIELCQFNRGATKMSRDATMHDLRGSGRIGEDATTITLIKRNEQSSEPIDEYAKFTIVKNREGGLKEVDILWSKVTHSFENFE